MFAAEYFRTQLRRDAEALGGEPVVEIYLANGHSHRVHSIIDAAEGYVVLEVYQRKDDQGAQRPAWAASVAADRDRGSQVMLRAAIAYESIVEVRVDSSASGAKARPGFFGA